LTLVPEHEQPASTPAQPAALKDHVSLLLQTYVLSSVPHVVCPQLTVTVPLAPVPEQLHPASTPVQPAALKAHVPFELQT
jgi:hypothetical protein